MSDKNAGLLSPTTSVRTHTPIGDIQTNPCVVTRQEGSDIRATNAAPRTSERTNLHGQSGDPVKHILEDLANQTCKKELTDMQKHLQSKITYTGITLPKNTHLSLMPLQQIVNQANVNINNALAPAKEDAFAGGLAPEKMHLFLAANGSAEFCASAVLPTQEQSIANCSAYPPCNLL